MLNYARYYNISIRLNCLISQILHLQIPSPFIQIINFMCKNADNDDLNNLVGPKGFEPLADRL